MTTVSQVTGKELPVRLISRRGRPRPQRDFAAMERRRMRAVDLFEQGVIPAEIARQVGVSRPKLSRDQLGEVEAALTNGAEANGYTTDLWTLPRLAEVIERLSGVAYHPGHVWYLLHDLLGWTWQRPARRAVERNDELLERWVKQRWPRLKKGHGARTH